MSKADIWMPLYVGEYLADTMRLTTVQHGAYLLLLMQYWKSGPLPDDEDELAAIAKMEAKAWSKISTSIRRFFDVAEDGLLHQKRADFEREKAADISSKRRAAGAQRRDRKTASDDQEDGSEPSSDQQENVQMHKQKHMQLQPQLDTHARGLLQSPKQKKDSVTDVTDAKAPADPPSARDVLWQQGVPILSKLIGKSPNQCRSFLGKLLRDVQDDCPKALLIIQQAQEVQPVDPVAWLAKAASPTARDPAPRENAALRRIRETQEARHRLTYPELYADESPIIDQRPQGRFLQ